MISALHRRLHPGGPIAAALLAWCACLGAGRATESPAIQAPPVDPAAPAWRELAGAFALLPDTAASFAERRTFSFKGTPILLAGMVRRSATRGLSLHYSAPDEHTVILDDRGMLVRTPAGDEAPPADPRARAALDTLRAIVRFDLPALAVDFKLHGQIDPAAWSLTLVPRTAEQLRRVGEITVTGEGATLRRIAFRRGAKQVIEILIAPPRPPAPFTAEELQAHFR